MTVGLILAAAAGGVVWSLWTPLPKRFAEVVPGRLYRCGEVSPAHLKRLAEQFKLRTVLSLLNPDAPESVAERTAAERMHLKWLNVPLPGNGQSTSEERERIAAIVCDDALGPLLVHCAAGTNRTGLAIGLYRIRQQHWNANQVLDEMSQFDFRGDERHENLRAAIEAEAAGKP